MTGEEQPVGPQNDVRWPNIVFAPSPANRSQLVKLFASEITIRQRLDDELISSICQYAGLIHGAIPGGYPSLPEAFALFRGIRRPMVEFERDEAIHVYVTNPPVDFVFVSTHQSNGGPQRVSPPKDSVFVIYSDFSQHALDGLRGNGDIEGVIYDWEWVLADPGNSSLPDGFSERYAERIW